MKSGIALAASTLVVLVAPAPSLAGWSHVQRVSRDARTNTLDATVALAENANGEAVAVWAVDGVASRSGQHMIEASLRSARGAWSKPTVVSGVVKDPYAVRLPDVAIDSHGSAVVSWALGRGAKRSIMAAASTATGQWSRPHLLGRGQLGSSVSIVDGTALVVWPGVGVTQDPSNDLEYVRAAWWSARHGWGRSRTVGRFHLPEEVRGVLTGPRDGALTLTTTEQGTLFALRIQRGRFGAPQRLGSTGLASTALCAGQGGPVAVLWFQDSSIFARVRTAGGAWGGSVRLTDDGNFPHCAADGKAGLASAWIGNHSGLAQVSTRPRGRAWSAPATISSSALEPAQRVSVALAPSGALGVGWLFSPPGSASPGIGVAARSAAGVWSPAFTAAADRSEDPETGISGRGIVDVVWPHIGATSAIRYRP